MFKLGMTMDERPLMIVSGEGFQDRGTPLIISGF